MRPFPPATFVTPALLLAFAPAALAQWIPDGTPVCTAAGSQYEASACADGGGGTIIAWQDSRQTVQGDLFAQRLDASGAALWTLDGVVVCTASRSQFAPVVVSDGAGGAIIAWYDERIGPKNADIYARHISATGVALWRRNGVALTVAPRTQQRPRIVSDDAGGAIVCWEDFRNGGPPSDPQVFAQRVSGAGVPLWAANGIGVSSSADRQRDPAMIADGAGGAIIAWGSVSLDIWAQRVSATGTRQWGSTGAAICTATNGQVSPLIAPDGAGGAVVSWDDGRYGGPGASDIYAQRVNEAGVPQWITGGVPVQTAHHGHGNDTIAADGTGGAVIAWVDDRSSPAAYDVYAQRVSGTGGTLWEQDGVVVCANPDNDVTPHVVSDGGGGGIFTWFEPRELDTKVFVQRVDGAGIAQWAANGIPVSGSKGQNTPTIAADAAGGAVIAWTDTRKGTDEDLYAQHVGPDGTLGDPALARANTHAEPAPLRLSSARTDAVASTLDFALDTPGHATLRVFEPTGRLVRVLLDAGRPAGAGRAIWDGHDAEGRAMPAGVYIVELRVGSLRAVERITRTR